MTAKRVVVAMSGGVDSTLASFLLKEEGREVIGVNLKLTDSPWGGGAEERINVSRSDSWKDAQKMALKLEIPFYSVNLEEEFQKEVIDYFCGEYFRGRTPNPCLLCNQKIKFGALLARANSLGADYVATGHYARVEYNRERKRYLLKKGRDIDKDQSYFLSTLSQEQLGHALFPLGSYTKGETRKMAKELGLKVHNKPESQEICFVPDGDYHKFLRKRLAQEARPGPIVDTRGKILGDHQGIMFYTIGQRRGLGIAKGFPLYVIAIDKDKNEIMVGEKEATYQSEFIASGMNWISDDRIEFPLKVKVKIRYNHKGEDATVFPLPHGKVKVRFKRPQPAITPGQAAAFYRDDVVVGGGWIDEVRN